MTLDELGKYNHISQGDYDTYHLFSVSEVGSKWLKEMQHLTFMDQPAPENYNGEAFAYMDGRRSIIRDINTTISIVQQLLQKEE